MSTWAQGSTAGLDATIRDLAGALADSDDPVEVDILDPAGDLVVTDDPPTAHPSVGRYRYDWDVPADAAVGSWTVRWAAVVDGVDVAAEEVFQVAEPGAMTPENAYGATLDLVENYLPTRPPFTVSTTPSAGEVLGLMAQVATDVNLRLGDLERLEDDVELRIVARAREVIALGTAAYAEAAAHPAKADPSDATSYAQWLLARYTEALDSLVELVDVLTPGEAVPGAGPLDSEAAALSGPPMFTRRTGF